MGALSQSPTEIAECSTRADSRLVRLELDIAHYAQGGGNPAEAVRELRGSVCSFFTSRTSRVPCRAAGRSRIGSSSSDVAEGQSPGVFAALKAVGFDGWAVVELDEVPDKARGPRRSRPRSRSSTSAGLGLIEF